MKRLLFFIVSVFVFIYPIWCETININWMVGDSVYDTSTCTVGDDLIIPTTPPTKYGYHFVGWGLNYRFLEYIETNGHSYIILDGYATNDTSYEMVVTKKCSGVGKGLYGAASSTSWPLGSGIECSNNDNTVYLLNGGETVSTGFITNLETHIIQNKNIYTATDANGTRTYTQPGGDFQTTYKICMGAITAYGSARPCASVWKYFNVSGMVDSNGNVLPDVNLVPVRRVSDNTIGMYDQENKRFYTNAGTGEFIAGPEL